MGRSLYLNRLVVYPSEKTIDVSFRKGLNVVLANDTGTDTAETRNSVGKSTFVQLIDYGLGSAKFLPNDKRDAKIRMQKYYLYLEFSIGKDKYTIQRNLIDGDYVQIYTGWVIDSLISQPHNVKAPELKQIDEYRTFFEDEIFRGLNLFNDKRLISWRQIAPFLMRDQVGGFQELSKPASYSENAELRRKRIDFFLNLLTPQKKQLESRKETTDKLVEEKHKAYSVIKQYAERKINVTDTEIKTEIEKVKQSIRDVTNEITDYKQQLLDVRKRHDVASRLREQFAREILMIDNNIATHQHRIENYSATINEIKGELHKVDVATLAAQFFKRYNYKFCPTCLRQFTPDSEEDCTHSIHNASDEVVNLIKKVMVNESRELSEAIEIHRGKIEQLKSHRNELKKNIELIDVELNLDLSVIIDFINRKEKELNELRPKHAELLNMANVSGDVALYYDDWQREKKELDDIKKSLEKLNKEADGRLETFKYIVNEVVDYLYDGSRTGVLNRSVKVGNLSIDICYKNANDGIDDGAAATTIRVIAFDLALLKLSVLQDTNYPRFLIHDSPNVRDIDLNVYRRIFSFILNMENDMVSDGMDVDFQYIITTIDIPDELRNTEFVRLTLDNSGERGKLFGFTF